VTVEAIAGGSLGSVNFAADLAAKALFPLGAALDGFLAASLGPLQANLQAQLNAQLSTSVAIGLQIGDPLAGIKAALAAVGTLAASLQASLAFPISFDIGIQLSATLKLIAELEVQLGLLNIAIDLLLKIKIPALEAAANILAELNAGSVILVELDGTSLATLGGEIQTKFNSSLVFPTVGPPTVTISPTTPAFGYILITALPATKGSLDFVLRGI